MSHFKRHIFMGILLLLTLPVLVACGTEPENVSNETASAAAVQTSESTQREASVEETAEAVSETTAAENDAVVVCILDSGCGDEDAKGWNYLTDTSDLTDSAGHGTAMCRIFRELEPEAELIMLKCFEGENSVDEQAIIRALEEAVSRWQADVILMSFAVTTADEALETAVQEAATSGAILLAAAGNLSTLSGPGSTIYPAAFEEVIGIGGVNLSEDGTPKSSSWYLTGEEIFVCGWAQYGELFGTSYAVPRIGAWVSRYLAKGGERSAEAVQQALKEAAADLGREGYDTTYGWGYVEVR